MARYKVYTVVDDTYEQQSDSSSLQDGLNRIKDGNIISVILVTGRLNESKIYEVVVDTKDIL